MAISEKTDPLIPDLQIEFRPIGSLLRYAQNSRDHSPEQIQQIAESMKDVGFVNPCLVDPHDVLIAGHGRIAAAQLLGMVAVPVIRLGHLTELQARKLRIADNQLALSSTWNKAALRAELIDLADLGCDLTSLGFSDLQVVEFMAGAPAGKDPEAVPEPLTTPVSKLGDLWVLGQHRLMCGDATSAKDVERLLEGAKPHLMVTDPPYGVDYDPTWRERDLASWKKPISLGLVKNDDESDWSEAWKLFPGDVVYAWHPPGAKSAQHLAALNKAGFEARMQIIWAKQHFPIGRGNYHVQHEPCWYAVRKGKTAHWQGSRTESTLWQIDNACAFKGSRGEGDEQTGHSTQKPVECMRRPIENNSKPGDAVYDPFLGSGTTLIAAEITGRKALGLEIDQGYCDVIVQRWQDLVGKEARHAVSGLTYAEERDARAKLA
jgi:DNA modification methylase